MRIVLGFQDASCDEIEQSGRNLLEPGRIAEILADPNPANWTASP